MTQYFLLRWLTSNFPSTKFSFIVSSIMMKDVFCVWLKYKSWLDIWKIVKGESPVPSLSFLSMIFAENRLKMIEFMGFLTVIFNTVIICKNGHIFASKSDLKFIIRIGKEMECKIFVCFQRSLDESQYLDNEASKNISKLILLCHILYVESKINFANRHWLFPN